MSGIELYDHIMDLRARGARITTTVMGQAASMGGILAQAGETRRIGPNGYLMIHEVAAGLSR